jgi:hypothetical protein
MVSSRPVFFTLLEPFIYSVFLLERKTRTRQNRKAAIELVKRAQITAFTNQIQNLFSKGKWEEV